MYTITLIPTRENHTVEIPEEFFGKEINIKFEEKTDMQIPDENRINQIREKYKKYKKIDMNRFKFDRDEANTFD